MVVPELSLLIRLGDPEADRQLRRVRVCVCVADTGNLEGTHVAVPIYIAHQMEIGRAARVCERFYCESRCR